MKLVVGRLAVAGVLALEAGAATIVSDTGAPPLRVLAAREVQRYVFLRTGDVLPVRTDRTDLSDETIVLATDGSLAPQQFRLKTEGATLTISGGDDLAVLYGAYRFAEILGVRFYLHGDVIPDTRIAFALPVLDETRQPLFEVRGIQPFHDFTEGPDWWTLDDYKSYAAQLAKLRMNFMGFHCYPEGGVGPEPLVWIGLPQDVNEDGTVASSYPSRYASTSGGSWGYAPAKSSAFAAGASLLFPDDDHGSPITRGHRPLPLTPDSCNDVFNRAGRFFREAFDFGRALGIRCSVGTETPLTIPNAVQARLQAEGLDPKDPAVVRRLYEGMFRRIAAAHPVDYYWLWTPEDWTWSGVKQEKVDATLRDIEEALAALQDVGKPFGFATCGWVLGPPQERALFDKRLPKDVAVSCINRNVGFDWVEPGFAGIEGRPKWAIPWMEDDPAMILPQLWAGRMRRDAADALAYGCTGLLGIHWRTKVLAPNVSALAAAAWDQGGWNPGFGGKAAPVLAEDGYVGGSVASHRDPIEGTEEDPVYQSCRYNLDAYRLRVPDGVYTVSLKFCEIHYEEPGQRVFGASVQGRKVAERLDVFEKAGKNRAYDVVAEGVVVSNGQLRIDFDREVEFPFIAGIAVTGMTAAANQVAGEPFARRINCGGEAWEGYEADLPAAGGAARVPAKTRDLPVDDFYRDWAEAWFGPEVAAPMAAIFNRLDGGDTTEDKNRTRLPRPADWIAGPGGIKPNPAPWGGERARYAFVEEMEALRPSVMGGGYAGRFDYWLNTFRYLRAVGEIACSRGDLDRHMQQLGAEKDALIRETLLREAVGVRVQMARQWESMMTLLLQTVDTPGEMGTVANLEQHVRRNPNDGGKHRFLDVHDAALAQALGRPLPPEVEPGKDYTGTPRIVVPTARTLAGEQEALKLMVTVLARESPPEVRLLWRRIGESAFQQVSFPRAGLSLYQVMLPPPTAQGLEYYLRATTPAGDELVWPASAPIVNQTVVGFDAKL
jgi:hypothetical protein